MKRYRSHKEVEAFKIESILKHNREKLKKEFRDTPFQLVSEEEAGVSAWVSQVFMDKHEPKEGGYFVRYSDGYESWSPAEAFEEGYHELREELGPVPWGELDLAGRVERLRQELRHVIQLAGRLNENLYRFHEHHHNAAGEVCVRLHEHHSPQAMRPIPGGFGGGDENYL